MSNLYDYINIKKLNIEKEINECINETNKELDGLYHERTCIIYSGYIYIKLRKKGIVARLMDTNEDCKMSYKHEFVIVPNDSDTFYLIDLTYEQFGENPLFHDIYETGYQLMDKNLYKIYLETIQLSTDLTNKR